MSKVKNLTDLFSLVLENPKLAKSLKNDPESVAQLFGVRLTKSESDKIKANLDVNQILKAATQVNSMAAKAMAGIGLRNPRE